VRRRDRCGGVSGKCRAGAGVTVRTCVCLARWCVTGLSLVASAPWRATSKTLLKPPVPLRPSCPVPLLTYRHCNPSAVVCEAEIFSGRSLFRRLTGPDLYREGGARNPAVLQAALQVEGLRRSVGAYPPLSRLCGSRFEMQRLVALLFDLPRFAAVGRLEECVPAGIASLPPVDHHAAARLGPETEFQNRAKTVLGVFVEDVLLAPRLATVGAQQHEWILR
jgi:hypothetical protein